MKHVRAGRQTIITWPTCLRRAIWFESVLGLSSKSLRNDDGSEVLLLQNMDFNDIVISSKTSIPVYDFADALFTIGIHAEYEIFQIKRLAYLEQKYKVNVFLYERSSNVKTTLETRKKKSLPHKHTLRLLLAEEQSNTLTEVIENFHVITSKNLLPKYFICNILSNCKYMTFDRANFARHIKLCASSNQKKIICKQKAYGDGQSTLKDMVERQILPAEVLKFCDYSHATFDIETTERRYQNCHPTSGTVREADLVVLSIAVGSNIDTDYVPKCWIRRSSDPKEEKRMIQKVIMELKRIQKIKLSRLPSYIDDAEVMLMNMREAIYLKSASSSTGGKSAKSINRFELQRIYSYQRQLDSFKILQVYGFNSSKFDIPTIAGALFTELMTDGAKVSVLKKTTSYFNVSTNELSFCDILKYTAPCNLDKFLKVWEAPQSKGIWPYSYYSSIEEIKQARKFPPFSAFTSELKGQSISMPVYIAAKREFYRRKLLLPGDPDRITSMKGWLRTYNITDVQPLSMAIETCFQSYYENFSVNPMLFQSLPALAQAAMFKNFDSESPLFYSFPEKYKRVCEIFRQSVIGGLVNVFLRHASTFDQKGLPTAARCTPNGNPMTHILMLDFNSMYLACQDKELPTGTGILWEKNRSGGWRKNIMTSGHSLKAQKWLCYMQETDPFLTNKDGTRATIACKYLRGEEKLVNSKTGLRTWSVDGYAKSDQGVKVYEFLGDEYHDGCPDCDPNNIDTVWIEKQKDIIAVAQLEHIWECQFDKLLPLIRHVETPLIPHILVATFKETDILDSIKNNCLFGYIVADISTPDYLIPEMSNFPPIMKRMTVTNKHLTAYMEKRYKLRNPHNGKLERETVVQCFNAKNHLLLTSLAKYYLDKGLIINNITKVIQYTPRKALHQFVKHVKNMRIIAEKEGKKTKANTAKQFGNQAYGKVNSLQYLHFF